LAKLKDFSKLEDVNTINNKPNHPHIAEHSLAENHIINWNGGKVIKTKINDFQRRNYESLPIRIADSINSADSVKN
jgi:hypothetical protein